MTRKVICMQDNKTVSVSQCNADTIMFSSEKCNDEPCDEGKIFASLIFNIEILSCFEEQLQDK